MSSIYYNQKWQEAISELLETVEQENYPLVQNQNQKGITFKRSDLQWFQYYAGLYIRYIESYRKLQDSYDQMIHPQKRILMKQMLENVIVRMCEVKQNLIRYSTHTNTVQSDYINIDEILMEMKLTPKALKIPLPRYFLDQKTVRDEVLEKVIKDLGVSQQEQLIQDTVALDTNLQTAIRIIQKLERGRQGIIRGIQFNKLKNKAQKDRNSSELVNQQDQRAIFVQKYWRAFLARKQLQKIRDQQLLFLGIKKKPIQASILQQAENQRKKIKILQKNREQIFENDKIKLRGQIKKIEQPSIKANMLDERRKWIKKFLEMHQFSNLPNNATQFYKNKDIVVEQQAKPKDKKDKGKQQNKGKGKKNEVEKYLDTHIGIGPTECVVKLQQNIKSYTQSWGTRDQTQISQEFYDSEMAKDQIRPSVEDQLQKLVDSIINLELDNMRIKYAIKKKKDKKKKKKKKKQKKVKIPQGLGKKDPKQLLEQLFEKKIAKTLCPAKLDDFIGEHNPVTYLIQKNSELQPDPALSQVKNLVAQYVGIPLGSQMAKQKLEKWNWFLFYGAMGTGKTLMIRALHKETNSLVFDLTPQFVKEKYSEKSELAKLIWSVIICAKQYQPSIIMIDDFQTIFPGAKPKNKHATPSFGPKMKKIIVDMKKNKLWTKTDRISVIACTNKPFDASLKDMKKMFDKKIYFPYPNYATRKQLIRQLIQQKCKQKVDYFPYQTFAHVTEGFTAGSFKNCIDKVLTPMRIERLKDEQLKVSQLINPLSNSICVFAEEYQKIRKFMDDVSGLKERRQAKKLPKQQQKKQKKKVK